MLIFTLIVMIICALQIVWARQTLHAALWLAAVSGLASLALYLVGLWQLAVIELSVGTGLVTVLMVFAISIVGDDLESDPPQWVALIFTATVTAVLIWMTLPAADSITIDTAQPLAPVMWEARALDIIAQLALMFVAVLGITLILRLQSDTEHQEQEAV